MDSQKQFLTVWNFLLGIVIIALAIFLSGFYGSIQSNWHSIYLVLVALASFFASMLTSVRKVAMMDLIIAIALLITPVVVGLTSESTSFFWWLPDVLGFTQKNLTFDVLTAIVFLILYVYGRVLVSRLDERKSIDLVLPPKEVSNGEN